MSKHDEFAAILFSAYRDHTSGKSMQAEYKLNKHEKHPRKEYPGTQRDNPYKRTDRLQHQIRIK